MPFFIRKGGGAGGAATAGKKRKGKTDTKGKGKRKKIEDEEIDSDEADVVDDVGYESEEDNETAEEKKLRLARMYLQEIEKELEEKRDAEAESGITTGVEERLKEDVDAERGKLRREVAAQLNFEAPTCTVLRDHKVHKLAITCMAVSSDGKRLYTASKDRGLVMWEAAGGKAGDWKRVRRVAGVRPGAADDNQQDGHQFTVMSIAISSDNKYLATGDQGKLIYIWNAATMERIHIFKGHRGPVSGLAFRRGTHTLYSCSHDRSVKVWSVDEKAYVETMFGHQDNVTAIDAGHRERAVTAGGRDGSVIVWKIVEESRLIFNGPTTSIDCVKLVNEEHWVSAGEDGHLAVWGVMKKKPLAIVQKCHGQDPVNEDPYWVSAVGTLYNSDLVVTGSRDGWIRFWSVGDGFRSIKEVGKVQVNGFVNSLTVCNDGRTVIAGVGQEHRLGRWWRLPEAKNSIVIIQL